MRFLRASVCAVVVAVACGPVDQSSSVVVAPPDGGVGGAPPGGGGAGGASPPTTSVQIVSPANGGKCKADNQGNCGISVAVSGGTVAAPGKCGAAQRCGHIDLFIDGTACGSPNVQSGSDTVTANFGRCRKIEGEHTVMVELRDDRGGLLARSQVVRVEVEKEKHHGDGDDDD